MLHVILAGCAGSIFLTTGCFLKGLWLPKSLYVISLTYYCVSLKADCTKNLKKVTLPTCLIQHCTVKAYGGVSALMLVPKQCWQNATK